MDLKFPHHECEMAQNQVASSSHGARFWMHANMLTLNGKKMSKSTGNTLNPDELFSGNNTFFKKGFSPSVVRFFIMQAHYRSELDFSSEALEAAEKGFSKITEALKNTSRIPVSDRTEGFDVEAWRAACYWAMNDDFNTPVLIAHLFDAVSALNKAADGSIRLSAEDILAIRQTTEVFLYQVMGIAPLREEGGSRALDRLVENMIRQRNQARAEKDWALSDKIRDELKAAGVVLKDGKEGTTYSLEN